MDKFWVLTKFSSVKSSFKNTAPKRSILRSNNKKFSGEGSSPSPCPSAGGHPTSLGALGTLTNAHLSSLPPLKLKCGYAYDLSSMKYLLWVRVFACVCVCVCVCAVDWSGSREPTLTLRRCCNRRSTRLVGYCVSSQQWYYAEENEGCTVDTDIRTCSRVVYEQLNINRLIDRVAVPHSSYEPGELSQWLWATMTAP